jgi:multiple sugar transport system substrate-binding protein
MGTEKSLTRREFLRNAALYGAAIGFYAGLSGCVVPTPVAIEEAAEQAAGEGALPFEGITLEWADSSWYKPGLQVFQEAFAAGWARANGADIEISRNAGDELLQIAATMAETGLGPDLYHARTHIPSLYPEAFVDVGDICDELAEKDGPWTPASEVWCKVDGVWRAVPWVDFPGAWNYRIDYLEGAGWDHFPDTMEELMAFAKDAHAYGKPIGLALGHTISDPNRHMYAMFWVWGAQELDETGTKVMLDSPETADALQYMQDLFPYMHEGCLAWGDAENNQAFFAETCSATINVNTIYLEAVRQGLEWAELMRHVEQPEGPGGRPVYQEGLALAINAESENIDASKALLRAFFDSANFGEWLKEGEAYITSPLERYTHDEYLPEDPIIRDIPTYQKDPRMAGWPGPYGPAPAEAIQKYIIVDMMAKAASGENIKDIIQWGVQEWENILQA